jgi:hypothetical protein
MIKARYTLRGLKTICKEDSIMLHCHIPPKASLVFSFLILLGVGHIFFEEQANASSEYCTVANVKGAFGATFTGTVTAGELAGPYAAVSRVVCDGNGVCHGEGTQSFNGVIVPLVDMVANYTVNPDCTGSITVDLGAGETIKFNFVIVDRGKELRSIQTDPNVVITGNLRQQ